MNPPYSSGHLQDICSREEDLLSLMHFRGRNGFLLLRRTMSILKTVISGRDKTKCLDFAFPENNNS
jgi:hypothetical protein